MIQIGYEKAEHIVVERQECAANERSFLALDSNAYDKK